MGSRELGFYIDPVFAIVLLIALTMIVWSAVLFSRWVRREK
jgi:hypothetical protein